MDQDDGQGHHVRQADENPVQKSVLILKADKTAGNENKN